VVVEEDESRLLCNSHPSNRDAREAEGDAVDGRVTVDMWQNAIYASREVKSETCSPSLHMKVVQVIVPKPVT
jgi:hypothetical protein